MIIAKGYHDYDSFCDVYVSCTMVNQLLPIYFLMTQKVIYRNWMKGKRSHSNAIRYQVYLQMRLEKYFAEVEEKWIISPHNDDIYMES